MDDELDMLYRRFAFTVHRRCEALLQDADEAQEVTHEVFLRVLERGDVDIQTPSSFFYVIATRLCLNRLRNRKNRKTSSNSDLLDQIVSWRPSAEDESAARMILRKLFRGHPEQTRLMAVLHHLDGLTLQETATALGTSVSTVRRRLRQLKHELEDMEGT